jgi:hypothetical protein
MWLAGTLIHLWEEGLSVCLPYLSVVADVGHLSLETSPFASHSSSAGFDICRPRCRASVIQYRMHDLHLHLHLCLAPPCGEAVESRSTGLCVVRLSNRIASHRIIRSYYWWQWLTGLNGFDDLM